MRRDVLDALAVDPDLAAVAQALEELLAGVGPRDRAAHTASYAATAGRTLVATSSSSSSMRPRSSRRKSTIRCERPSCLYSPNRSVTACAPCCARSSLSASLSELASDFHGRPAPSA